MKRVFNFYPSIVSIALEALEEELRAQGVVYHGWGANPSRGINTHNRTLWAIWKKHHAFHVFGLWEKTAVLGENLTRIGRMFTLHAHSLG